MPEADVLVMPGAGSVEPTGKVDLESLKQAMSEAQKPVQSSEIVCIDERPSTGEPIRRKAPGGATMTGYAAVLLTGGKWSLLKDEQRESSPVEWYKTVAALQKESGMTLGGHTDNHAEGDASNCGAADKLVIMIEDAADHGLDKAWVDLAEEILGENFDREIWNSCVESAKEISHNNKLAGWKGVMMLETLRESDGVIEVLNGDHDVERDPENKRHNHWAEGININTVAGHSNDRDNSEIPFFQVDVEAVAESVQPLSTSDKEFVQLLHGAVLYTEAVAYRLTSKQPVIL